MMATRHPTYAVLAEYAVARAAMSAPADSRRSLRPIQAGRRRAGNVWLEAGRRCGGKQLTPGNGLNYFAAAGRLSDREDDRLDHKPRMGSRAWPAGAIRFRTGLAAIASR